MPLHAPPSLATLYYQNLNLSSLDSSKASKKIKADSSKPSKPTASKGLPPSYSATDPSKGSSSFFKKYF
ncbi:hypothetical protein M422DRAFT_241283 [Sphaerobolus stellatus SS14]|nr:hypothetical protein M422DRAFT_241283 [Sphaerobolus stellatus SS14]